MDRQSEEVTNSLLAKNILLVHGEIEGSMVLHVYKCLAALEARGSPDLEVRFFTPGGKVIAGLDIYDALRRYKGKKTGIVYAYARSMGAVVLQACDERVCLQHAKVLIHHVNSESISLDTIEDRKRLKKLRDNMWENQKAIYGILTKRTGKSARDIRLTCKKDVDMSAEEAKKFGLIDRIEDEQKHGNQ